jgi:hypothetical protein
LVPPPYIPPHKGEGDSNIEILFLNSVLDIEFKK